VKFNVLVDLEAMPTPSPDNVRELQRHKRVILEIQSSVNPDAVFRILLARGTCHNMFVLGVLGLPLLYSLIHKAS